ncbi:PhoH family protein [bacterium]|nr:PhoH family protein [bacterium]
MPNNYKNISTSGKSIRVSLRDIDQRGLFGPRNLYVRDIELKFPVKLVARGDELQIFGEFESARAVESIINQMIEHLVNGGVLSEQAVEYAIGLTKNELPSNNFDIAEQERIVLTNCNDSVRPRSEGQSLYIKAIAENDLIFSIGPAGTGKTYLAVACAIRAFKERQCTRIVLVRPAVETDESLGFLPGDLKEKVDPYLRPLYDALYEMLPSSRFDKLIAEGTIEVAPLAYMRGRTLNNSFVILDEAQNTTIRQMKMFLTRLGTNSKAVVTGDITQIDLPTNKASGLIDAQRVLEDIEGIEFVYLNETDVVRHRLVQKIILAYDKVEKPLHSNHNQEDDKG